MSIEQVASETKGVAVELLATVDLGLQIQGMEGRQLRMQLWPSSRGSLRPGSRPQGRPGTVYGLQGTITDQRTTGRVLSGPRTGTPSTGSRTGTVPAVQMLIVVLGHDQAGGGRTSSQQPDVCRQRAVGWRQRRCRQSEASSLAVMSSRPRVDRVLFASARKSRAKTTDAMVISASIVGVSTSSRSARSVKNTKE